jgi:hypothetical protein
MHRTTSGRYLQLPGSRRSFRLSAAPGEFLADDQLRRYVPSIFAETAHASRSGGSAPISTSTVLRALECEGFYPVQARQSTTRDEGRIDFTKHLLRLRHRDQAVGKARAIGDVFPEVVLVNANDGSSSYHVSAGLFRLICLNGMTVSEKEFQSVRVTHWGDVAGKVIEGSFTVLEEAQKALEHAESWAAIDLSHGEQMAFAESARVLRFGDSEGHVTTPITAAQLLQPNRYADGGPSLWKTFNRVQENVIKGGLKGRTVNAKGKVRNMQTHAVNGIDQDQRLNRALWLLGETMAGHKAA